MSLIKKTIVLTNEKPVGYLTLIRLGNTVGAKFVYNEPVGENMWIALRAGDGQYMTEIRSQREELSPDISFGVNDPIGVVLADGKHRTLASGGRKELVNMPQLFAEMEKNTAIPASAVPEAVAAPVTEAPKIEEAEPVEQGSEAAETEILSQEQAESANPFNVPKGENFYQTVRSRLEEILTINPKEEALEKMIPESRFVRVKYEGEDYYVVGVLSDEGITTHIAYGVPGISGIRPPREAEHICDFLPVPELRAKGYEGYWLMFQDAKDGGMVKN